MTDNLIGNLEKILDILETISFHTMENEKLLLKILEENIKANDLGGGFMDDINKMKGLTK